MIIIEPKIIERELIQRNNYPIIRGLLGRLGIIVKKRTMQSDNYEADVSGWKLSEILAEFENIKSRGNLERNDFHWTTIFASIDGFGTSGEAPVISGTKVALTTLATNGSTSLLRKSIGLAFYYFNWDYDRRFRTRLYFSGNAAQEVWITSGGIGNQKHIGFKVIDGILYGTVANNTSESTLNYGAVSNGAEGMALDVKFETGSKATFIVDGVIKGTITTNLPTSGAEYAPQMLNLYIKTTEDVAKTVEIGFYDFWQAA